MSTGTQAYRNGVSAESEQKLSIFRRKKCDIDKVFTIYNSLEPLTYPYQDQRGNTLRLWKHGVRLIGAVLSVEGDLTVVAGVNIKNPLAPEERENHLLQRLTSTIQKSWHLIFDPVQRTITLFPILEAAGKDQRPIRVAGSPIIKLSREDLIAKLLEKIDRKTGEKLYIFKGENPGVGEGCFINTRTGVVWRIDHRDRGRYDGSSKERNGEPNHVDLSRDHKQWQKVNGRRNPAADQAKANPPGHKWRFAYKDDYYENGPPKGPFGRSRPTPDNQKFTENLQKTRLTDSYNNTHKDNPIPARGATGGSIGGVGCSSELIRGLFDSPESLFETRHYFFIPGLEEGLVSQGELSQVLRELTIGIYQYDTIPFFSLHFNPERHLFPIIHPAYQNTLVGKVVSMLDYFMKGYINGVIYSEEFVYKWAEEAAEGRVIPPSVDKLINLSAYCRDSIPEAEPYLSLSSLVDLTKLKLFQHLPDADKDAEILKDYTQFSNSARIIAKQVSIQKEGSLFVLDGDFDVFYTIEPTPAYASALTEHKTIKGHSPAAYQILLESYEEMRRRIHDHMPTLPIFKKYFALLNIINFFCSYLVTLKKHRKMPTLRLESIVDPQGCPALFPHLPKGTLEKVKVRINIKDLLQAAFDDHSRPLTSVLRGIKYKRVVDSTPFLNAFSNSVWTQVVKPLSLPHQRAIEKDHPIVRGYANEIKKIIEALFERFLSDPKIDSSLKTVEIFLGNFQVSSLANIPPVEQELTLYVIRLPGEMSQEEQSLQQHIYGGCGMELKEQEILPSPVASALFQEQQQEFLNKSPEIMTYLPSVHDREGGYLFSLDFEDLSAEVGFQDFERISSTLLVDTTDEVLEKEELFEAMGGEDLKEFETLLEAVPNAIKLRDGQGRALLHLAAQKKDPAWIDLLLKKGADPRAEDLNGYTPLHYAAMFSKPAHMELLLSKHTSLLNKKSDGGSTPLVVAIQHDNVEAVAWLLSKKADAFTRQVDGYTPLHNALHYGNPYCVRMVLDALQDDVQSKLNAVSDSGATPLMLAAELDSPELVQLLLDRGANRSFRRKDGFLALDIAVIRNCEATVALLVDSSPFSETTVENAIKKSSLKILKHLIKKAEFFTYKNSNKETALILAARYAHLPVALMIVQQKREDLSYLDAQNVIRETALQIALQGGLYELVDALIAAGAKHTPYDYLVALASHGYSQRFQQAFSAQFSQLSAGDQEKLAFAIAVKGQHSILSSCFIPAGFDLDKISGPSGWKVEHYLAKSDGLFLLRQRLASKTDLLMTESEGKSLAFIAAENHSWSVLNFLVLEMRKQNISFKNHFKETHLFYPIFASCDIENVQALLETLKDPLLLGTPLNKSQMTAAHVGASLGFTSLLRHIKQKGGDLEKVDALGNSPLSYAIRGGHEKTVIYLLQQGVSVNAESIYLAAAQSEKMLSVVASFGANLETISQLSGDTPILLAVRSHDEKAFLRLHKRRASLECRNGKNNAYTPFILAAETDQLPLLKLIAASKPITKEEGEYALRVASKHKNVRCMAYLRERGCSPDAPSKRKGGLTATQYAGENLVLLHSLGKLDSEDSAHREFLNAYDKFSESIRARDKEELSSLLSLLDLNTKFQGLEMYGTPLQTLASIGSIIPEFRNVLSHAFEKENIDPLVLDNEGNTYAHLLVKCGIDPTQYPILKRCLKQQNYKGETPLHVAATLPFLNILSNLIRLQSVEDLEIQDNQGKTALFNAVLAMQLPAIEVLLKAKARVDALDYRGCTPLLVACELNNLPMVRLLLNFGADINRSFRGINPLHSSMQHETEDLFLFLMRSGANHKQRHKKGFLPEHVAAEQGKLHILRAMSAMGHSSTLTDNSGLNVMHHAAKMGNQELFPHLLDLGYSLEQPSGSFKTSKKSQPLEPVGMTPLLLASRNGNADAVKWLLDHQVNPEAQTNEGYDALAMAAMSGSAPLLHLLFEYNLSKKMESRLRAIEEAIKFDHASLLPYLYQSSVPIDVPLSNGFSGLELACLVGSLHATYFFVEREANPFSSEKHAECALELSAQNSSVAQFRFLIDAIRPPREFRNSQGETLVHVAVKAGKLGHLMVLADFEFPLDSFSTAGLTPLHIAVSQGEVEIAKMLLLCGASASRSTYIGTKKASDLITPETKNKEDLQKLFQQNQQWEMFRKSGETPIHLAIRANFRPALYLLARRHSLQQADKNGTTPLQLAKALGSPMISDLLRLEGQR